MSRPAEGILVLRRIATALVASVSVVVAIGIASPAYASNAGSFVAQINAARAGAGRAPLAHRADLASLALRHSQTMAAQNSLHHNAKLTSEVANWQAVGENVGMGGNTRVLHNAFMNSPAHRANILDKDFTEVGLGVVVDARGVMWVTEVFRQPMLARSSARVHTAAVAPVPARQTSLTRPPSARPQVTKRPAVRWATPRTTSPRAHRTVKSAWLTRLTSAAAGPAPHAAGALPQAVEYLYVVAG
ncbi:MAG: CAP domain-containing protein [Actinomycetota bacterium]